MTQNEFFFQHLTSVLRFDNEFFTTDQMDPKRIIDVL